jgi:hypothetical protein
MELLLGGSQKHKTTQNNWQKLKLIYFLNNQKSTLVANFPTFWHIAPLEWKLKSFLKNLWQKRHFRKITSPRVGEQRIGSSFLNFGLISCKSTKKCAKPKILNITVRIRKSKYHQKIPSERFAGNDINNYGLIFNTADSRKKNCVFL